MTKKIHVLLEKGQCDFDFWVPPLLTVDVDEDEFDRTLWETEPVDELDLRLVAVVT